MKLIRSAGLVVLAVVLLAMRFAAQDAAAAEYAAVITETSANISSTAAGGVWSAPSTWVGGAVPQAGDNVTIAGGATVIIDTAAAANSVTVGGTGSRAAGKIFREAGGSPAVLRFGETAGFSLTVAHDVTIGANDTLSTGGGNANAHVLTIGGNLTNNGVLDLSTNGNQAGATLVFTGASSNTFGGAGAVNDILWMRVEKGNSSANVLELAVSNFTVQGSATDGPASAFLFLNQGTFKISGTFSGNHRTFANPAYQIAAGAGLWLNNPNYTITAQHSPVTVLGSLRVTSGAYNVGTAAGDSLYTFQDSFTIIEGGSVTIAGGYVGANRFDYNQSGGTLTTCTQGLTSDEESCFATGGYQFDLPVVMTGGNIVVQNPPLVGYAYRHTAGNTLDSRLTGGTVHFGNAQTNGTGTFNARGFFPSISIDTAAGGHTLNLDTLPSVDQYVRNVNIGPGATLDPGPRSLFVRGDSFINNGTLTTHTGLTAFLNFAGDTTTQDVTYSGTGVVTGILTKLSISCHSLTFAPPVSNIRVRHIDVVFGDLINSSKLTIGNNDLQTSTLRFYPNAGSFDSAPVFEIDPGFQELDYLGTRTTGPEINPQRRVEHLFFNRSGGVLTVAGGDLTVNGSLNLTQGVVMTGSNKMIVDGVVNRVGGWVDGALSRRITATGIYNFWVGQGAFSPARATVNAIGVNPSYLTVTPVAQTLPGLLPATSASRYWKLEEIGDITTILRFDYANVDIHGNQSNYRAWRGTGGAPPVFIPSGVTPTAVTTTSNQTELTGNWGIGAELAPPVSISGTVKTAGGQPIANATLTLSGGGLAAPVVTQTGSFGTYQFSNLLMGATYTIRVDAKRYRFTPVTQVVTPAFGDVAKVNFVANPQ